MLIVRWELSMLLHNHQLAKGQICQFRLGNKVAVIAVQYLLGAYLAGHWAEEPNQYCGGSVDLEKF